MATQWDNFLLNLGEWHGTFASLNAAAEIVDSTASILTLEQGAEERLVHFRLRRYGRGDQSTGPSREISQEYRSLGRQVVFFSTGSFSKGSLQVAPGTAFGAEFGFVAGDRRHRLVQLYDSDGNFTSHVLIREFRAGRDAAERPALHPAAVVGVWEGEAATITADWPEPELQPCRITISSGSTAALQIDSSIGDSLSRISATGQGSLLAVVGASAATLHLHPDSGYSLVPLQVNHRQSFAVEAAWWPADDQLVRLIRRYDSSGAWRSATQITARRL